LLVRITALPLYGPQQADDFARRCVASKLGFLEHGVTVTHDLEATAARWNELYPRVGKRFTNLGRQPDGPGLVRSDGAVFDRDGHGVDKASSGAADGQQFVYAKY
jgi:hypothetical protein